MDSAAASNGPNDLIRRHTATARVVLALLIGVVLICVVAFFAKKFVTPQINPSLDMGVRITVLVLGLSSIALRRTKFSAMRLQDIGGLQGASGLLATLQRTTLQVALIACVITLVGLAGTLLTANDFYTYVGAVVAIAVLLYAYPVRRAWEEAVTRFAATANPTESSTKTL